MKIRDLLLYEDYGNLNAIDPKFRKIFSSSYAYGRGSTKISNPRVGAESPVLTVEPTKASAAANQFFGADNKTIQGMVLLVNGNQVLAIAKQVDRYDHQPDKPEHRIMLDATFYLEVEKGETRKAKVAKILNGYESTLRSGISDRNVSESQAKTVLTSIFNAAKELNFEISAFVVGVDTNRQQKKKDRAAAKHGAVALDQVNPKFAQKARHELRDRLDKFKAGKAEDYATPQEFLKAVIEKGFLEKISIDGFVYKLDRDQLRLSDIIKPDPRGWNNGNKIQYTIDSSNSEKYAKLKKDLWNNHDEKTPDQQAKIEALKAKFPPRDVYIILKMEGGKIVPGEVTTSVEKDFY